MLLPKVINKQTNKQASKQASKRASEQASKRASEQASKRANKQTSNVLSPLGTLNIKFILTKKIYFYKEERDRERE